MKRSASSVLPTLAAGVLLGLSFSVSAGGMTYDTSRWSGDQGYSLDQLAGEFGTTTPAMGLEAGQAGRAGPETVPMASTTSGDAVAWPAESRYSVYHLAAELEAAKAADSMGTGQAGRAGPESLPAAGADSTDMTERRFRIDDRRGGSLW